MAIIVVAADIPLNQQAAGTTPDVSGALQDRYQKMSFDIVIKTVVAFQVVETTTPVSFVGNIQPYTERQLMLRPEGERSWSFYWIQSITPIDLKVDDVIKWMGNNYRVMTKKNQVIYGFYEWSVVQDYTGSGPQGA